MTAESSRSRRRPRARQAAARRGAVLAGEIHAVALLRTSYSSGVSVTMNTTRVRSNGERCPSRYFQMWSCRSLRVLQKRGLEQRCGRFYREGREEPSLSLPVKTTASIRQGHAGSTRTPSRSSARKEGRRKVCTDSPTHRSSRRPKEEEPGLLLGGPGSRRGVVPSALSASRSAGR